MPVSCWAETDTVWKKNPLITDGNFSEIEVRPEITDPVPDTDYEDWHQENDWDMDESLDDGFEDDRDDAARENAVNQSE